MYTFQILSNVSSDLRVDKLKKESIYRWLNYDYKSGFTLEILEKLKLVHKYYKLYMIHPIWKKEEII
jgi:hypothetical protein